MMPVWLSMSLLLLLSLVTCSIVEIDGTIGLRASLWLGPWIVDKIRPCTSAGLLLLVFGLQVFGENAE